MRRDKRISFPAAFFHDFRMIAYHDVEIPHPSNPKRYSATSMGATGDARRDLERRICELPGSERRRMTAPSSTQQTGTVYWFTGLAGAGKTTIGRGFHEQLKTSGTHTVLLDGDALRDVFQLEANYNLADRKDLAMLQSPVQTTGRPRHPRRLLHHLHVPRSPQLEPQPHRELPRDLHPRQPRDPRGTRPKASTPKPSKAKSKMSWASTSPPKNPCTQTSSSITMAHSAQRSKSF